MLAVTFETFRQLTVDGFFRGCSYGLLGVGFALILGVTGRFHFAYGFTYALAAYMAFTFDFRWGLPFWPAAVLGVLVAGIAGAVIERGVYRPLARNAGATALLAVFVAALGIGIAGENLIRLLWGANTQAYFGPAKEPIEFWDTIFINFDWWQAVSAIVITLALAAMLRYTGARPPDQGDPRQPRPRQDDRHRRRPGVRDRVLPRLALRWRRRLLVRHQVHGRPRRWARCRSRTRSSSPSSAARPARRSACS